MIPYNTRYKYVPLLAAFLIRTGAHQAMERSEGELSEKRGKSAMTYAEVAGAAVLDLQTKGEVR